MRFHSYCDARLIRRALIPQRFLLGGQVGYAMANSYKCPLCISTHSYGSLEALEVHLDNVHIGKPSRPNIFDYISYPQQTNFDQFVEASINLELNKYSDGTVKVNGVELSQPLQPSKVN